MDQLRTKYLIDGYSNETLSEKEKEELLQVLSNEIDPLTDLIVELIEEESFVPMVQDEAGTTELFKKIIASDKVSQAPRKPVIRINKAATARSKKHIHKWLAAAVITGIIAASYLFLSEKPSSVQSDKIAGKTSVIAPGHSGAVLTLDNGKEVVLDSLGNGIITNQNGTVVYLNNEGLVYNGDSTGTSTLSYHTISTSKGRQFMLVLSDGSKVWLNSESSLRYPVLFSGTERRVEISGEVYFEVAKVKGKSFKVNVQGQAEIEVLGTHFNINAYKNEKEIKTTLIEGVVNVKKPSSRNEFINVENFVTLRPGQQARIRQADFITSAGHAVSNGGIEVVNDIDVSNATAWKNGRFNFEGMHLTDVMKQLERWYSIEVEYEKAVPDVEFYGELSRSNTLEEILAAFKDAEVKFRLQGRKLIVQK